MEDRKWVASFVFEPSWAAWADGRDHKKKDIAVQDDEGYRIYCYYPTTPNRTFEMYQIEMEPGCCHKNPSGTLRSHRSISWLLTAHWLWIYLAVSMNSGKMTQSYLTRLENIYTINRANKKNRLFWLFIIQHKLYAECVKTIFWSWYNQCSAADKMFVWNYRSVQSE